MSRKQSRVLCFVVFSTTLGSCSFRPNVPNGHILCQKAGDCPSGYSCEQVPRTDAVYSICCKDEGCASEIISPSGVDGSNDLATRYDSQNPVDMAGTNLDGQGDQGIDGALDSRGDISQPLTFDTGGIGDSGPPSDIRPSTEVLLNDDANQADEPADLPPTPDTLHDSWGPEAPAIPDAPSADLSAPDAQGTCGTDLDCPTTAPMCLKGICARCTSNNDCAANASGVLCDSNKGRCVACLTNTDCKNPNLPLCGGGKCTACTYATIENGCCADTDCVNGGAGSIGKCETSNICSYTCDTTHKKCGSICIPLADCCDHSDCTSGGEGTEGSCDASHKCNYRCDASHKECNGACITTANCCADADCPPVTLPNECQYQGCTANNTCGPKGRPSNTFCASGTAQCDGAGNCLICPANAYRCAENQLQQCNSTRTAYTKVSDCPADRCDASGGHCHVCVPGSTCDPANPHKLVTCSTDGMTSNTTTNDTKFCLNGEFVQCRNVSDCPLSTNPCVQAVCNANHECATTNASANVSCAGNGTCDGEGRCIGPVGKSCQGSTGLNCQGVSASGAAQTVSCCQSILVGGTFPMGRGSNDACPVSMSCPNYDQPEHTATITPYYLDAFEVTVGRFRKFYTQYSGPVLGVNAGANPRIANSGWNTSWNSNLPSSNTTLLSNIIQCTGSSWPQAGEPSSPDPEQRPVNCVTWYEAFAFCVYDGGRLPTEAEWELAAAGGDSNLFFPWGNFDPSLTTLPANYNGNIGSYKAIVGSVPAGVGRFGHLDLIGSVSEWLLDGMSLTWYSNASGNPCTDCADLTSADISYRVVRGGAWNFIDLAKLRSTARSSDSPTKRITENGFRCAHDKI
jgi:sulfatase modifying factor 1